MDHALTLGANFFKGHGHGNDYLVFEEGDAWSVTSSAVQAVCHRQRGAGGDGIVALLSPPEAGPRSVQGPGKDDSEDPSEDADIGAPRLPFRLRMFNPDGSEFERSGNGLRILGAYLFSRGVVGVGTPFPVEVGGERVEMEILGTTREGYLDVAVEMGRARFGPSAVGGTTEAFPTGTMLVGPDGGTINLHLVSMGNPHCVVIRDQLREDEFLELGPFLTSNPAFSAGANVQLVQVKGEGDIEILIWERGVGRTTSSGTSACAAASACVEAGLLSPGRIRVGMEGGSFFVTISREMEVRLEGPVEPLITGELSRGLLKGLH